MKRILPSALTLLALTSCVGSSPGTEVSFGSLVGEKAVEYLRTEKGIENAGEYPLRFQIYSETECPICDFDVAGILPGSVDLFDFTHAIDIITCHNEIIPPSLANVVAPVINANYFTGNEDYTIDDLVQDYNDGYDEKTLREKLRTLY